MLRLLMLISMFPMLAFWQTPVTLEQQTKAYSQVIAEYVKVVTGSNELKFDTLYIGKHEEFPNIKLPANIQGKKIILLTYQKGDTVPQNNTSFILINIVETKLTKNEAEFMLITFHKDYHPQHNCYIKLKYTPEKKEFERSEKIRFEYTYPKNK